MESGYEFDSLSELPPLPQVYAPMESYYPYDNIESLPPFPHSDFTFSDTHQNYLHLQKQQQSMFTDSSRSLLTRDYLTESTRFENLFSHDEPFLHLPDLKSVEDTNSPPCLSLTPPLHVARHNVNNLKQRHVGSRVNNNNTFSISPSSSSKPLPSSQSLHGTRKVSDRIRSLEKLMPWEKKMSLAMTLEETHKYITFLQSQIASLRWMPLDSVYPTKNREPGETNSPLKSLTRQQLLQVIANSPGSRNVLYTQGVCVFSYEQLLSVKMMAESSRNL